MVQTIIHLEFINIRVDAHFENSSPLSSDRYRRKSHVLRRHRNYDDDDDEDDRDDR